VNHTSGLISGAPTATGTFTVLLSATNAYGVGTTNLFLDIANNDPVQWAGNEHWYQAIWVGAPGISWPNASTAATNAHGHLATLTSSNENAFAYDLITDTNFWFLDGFGNGGGPWIGGVQPPGSPEPAGNWQWITGEAFSWNAWATNEPNNYDGNQDRIAFYAWQSLQAPTWDDRHSANLQYGYVVEWGTPPFPPVITSATNAGGMVGVAFAFQVQASNLPTNYTAIGLPSGLSLNSQSGLISGAPTNAGTNAVLLGAQNAFGLGTQTLWIAIVPQPTISTGRIDYALAFFPPLGALVMHGGWGPPDWKPLNETWKLDALGWKFVPVTNGPALAHHGMTYDGPRGVLVVCGAAPGGMIGYGTWEFDGTTWRRAANVPISGGGDVEVAFDPFRNRTVLYWAENPPGTGVETWEYNGLAWAQHFSLHHPVACADGALLKFDPSLGRVMLVGATNGGPVETWLWDGKDWTKVRGTQPTEAVAGGLAFDPSLNQMILLAPDMKTWAFDRTNWNQLHPPVSPSYVRLSYFALDYDPLRQVASFFGGEHYDQFGPPSYPLAMWDWDSTQWGEFPLRVRLAIANLWKPHAVVIAWPAVATNYALDFALQLTTPMQWEPDTNTSVVIGDYRYVTNTAPTGESIYRLHRP
jgi:hypothetical protein